MLVILSSREPVGLRFSDAPRRINFFIDAPLFRVLAGQRIVTKNGRAVAHEHILATRNRPSKKSDRNRPEDAVRSEIGNRRHDRDEPRFTRESGRDVRREDSAEMAKGKHDGITVYGRLSNAIAGCP